MKSYLFAFITLISSQALANDQKWGLGPQLGIMGSVPVAGVELVMPVSEEINMSYAYVAGERDLVDDFESISEGYLTQAKASLSETSVTFRWMLGKSFYLGAGVGYRQLQVDADGRHWMDDAHYVGKAQSESLQAKILIGNVWNVTDSFYLGADWVGLGLPLVNTRSTVKIEEFRSDSFLLRTEENDGELRQGLKKTNNAVLGSLLTLRLGYRF